jgi:ankyrin repeat protein
MKRETAFKTLSIKSYPSVLNYSSAVCILFWCSVVLPPSLESVTTAPFISEAGLGDSERQSSFLFDGDRNPKDVTSMDKQDKNRSAKGADSGRPTRVNPIVGFEGPFTELVDRGQTSEQHRQIEDPSDLFRLLRAAPNNAQLSDLILASRCGYRQKVEDLLIKGANVNENDGSGTTALLESLTYGHFEIAELLIQKGANVRAASGSGWTPLHLVASLGTGRLANDIVRRGGDLNAKTELG